jgi:hypothetical protein
VSQSSIQFIDCTALFTASTDHHIDCTVVSQDFESKNVKLVLANWKGPQRDMLERAGFYERVTDDTIFLTLHDAVVYSRSRVLSPRQSLTAAAGASAAAAAVASNVTEECSGGMQHTWKIGKQCALLSTRCSQLMYSIVGCEYYH